MNDIKFKHVYLIGNNYGFIGYTYEKDVLKGFLKHRKGNFRTKKVKTNKVAQHLHLDNEIIPISDKVYMTGSEEEFFNESFFTFLSDTIRRAEELLGLIKVLKLSEDEKKKIQPMIEFTNNIINYYRLYESGAYDDVADSSFDDIIDWVEAKHYFVKHVLDGTTS